MNFCSMLIALQVLVALMCHQKLFFSGWYWVRKQGQLQAQRVDTNQTLSAVRLVETSFQKVLIPGVFLQVQRRMAHRWWNQSTPLPVVASWYSAGLRAFRRMLLLVLTIRGSVSPFWPMTQVRTVMLSFLPLQRYSTASQLRQVPQMGKGLPLSFCLSAYLKMQSMLAVHWLSLSMGISPPGKKTPLILLRILSSWACEQ